MYVATAPLEHVRRKFLVDLGDGLTKWLEPSILSVSDLFMGAPADVATFHQLVVSEMGIHDESCILIVHCVGNSIDWERMSQAVESHSMDSGVPTWLERLWRKVETYTRLQQMAYCCSPMKPVPHPLLMEVVFSCGFGNSKDAFECVGW